MRERLNTLLCALGALFVFATLFLHGRMEMPGSAAPTTSERGEDGLFAARRWLEREGVPALSLRERFDTLEKRHDLPPTGNARCSTAFVVNSGGQAVGADTPCHGSNLAAVLWEHGSAYDLNTLIGRFPVHLAEAFYLSNRGEIACLGTLPNGNLRVVLLVPADLAARQGLSPAPATSLAPAQQRAAARSIPDPRDNPTSPLGQLAATLHPRPHP